MPSPTTALRVVVGSALVAGGLLGTAGALLGFETISPAYFAAAIAAGAGALGGGTPGLCAVRRRRPD
ncbi:hypothetical protein [Haloarcula litorea]|uniref:hypothetical protein n=1 Tax=Haloarcula litorea TaxID=3032579 RepID=UPI0023E89562|nr:hypothetical protein [Halomicroarcula sp. GDY20]